jgi:hypothetical protein
MEWQAVPVDRLVVAAAPRADVAEPGIGSQTARGAAGRNGCALRAPGTMLRRMALSAKAASA